MPEHTGLDFRVAIFLGCAMLYGAYLALSSFKPSNDSLMSYLYDDQGEISLRVFYYGMLVVGLFIALVTHLIQKFEVREEPPPSRILVPRPFTTEELSWYNGIKNSKKARAETNPDPTKHPLPEYDDLIFVGVKGKVFSVDPAWYGPESAYNAFAACDASRHLGKVVVGRDEINADWTINFDVKHAETLDDWYKKFDSKYPVAGWIIPDADFQEKAKRFAP